MGNVTYVAGKGRTQPSLSATKSPGRYRQGDKVPGRGKAGCLACSGLEVKQR